MQHRRLLPLLLPLFLFVACTEDQPPTAPAEPGGMAEGHTAGHKVVNSLADPGNGPCNATQCTLREAINDPQSTEISFAPGLTGTITLARSGLGGGTLVIEKTLSITGPRAGIVIQRRSTDPAFRIVRIGSGVAVRLTNLIIRNGKTDLPGGGIINFGSLTLTRCTVAGNSSSRHGGGIDSHGPLTLMDTKVVNNAAAERGGGIDSHDAPLIVTSSTIARNSAGSGGGVYQNFGPLQMTNSEISYNTGGGLQHHQAPATLDRLRVLGNSRGAGIALHRAAMTLTNSTVANNSAANGVGAIHNDFGGQLRVAGSTVANNSGAGILNEAFGRSGATVQLINSTVSGNLGAGISSMDDVEAGVRVTLVSTTVAFNSGPGIRQHGINGAGVDLTNSIVARNQGPTGPDISNTGDHAFVGASFSVIGDGGGSGITNNNGNQVGNVDPHTAPIDPLLGPLANNGGPTRTHALLLGSPAIDAASTPDCPPTDQRGVLRPQGAACDIGSFERAVQ